MCRSILFVTWVACIIVVTRAFGDEPITDPVADYLTMDVPDRVSNAGHLLIIKRVEVDLEEMERTRFSWEPGTASPVRIPGSGPATHPLPAVTNVLPLPIPTF